MKKLLSVFFVLILVSGLCGCEKKEQNKNANSDLEGYVSQGSFPGYDVSIGDKADDVLSKLKDKEKNDENGEYVVDVVEGETTAVLTDGSFDSYYKKSDSEKKIGFIVSYGDAFGYTVGDVISEVRDSLEGEKVSELSSDSEELFFFFGDTSAISALKVEFAKNSVIFVFDNSALATVAIYDNNWF